MPPSNDDYTSTEFRTNPYSMVRPAPIHKPHNSMCNHNSIAISSLDSSNSESDKKIEPKKQPSQFFTSGMSHYESETKFPAKAPAKGSFKPKEYCKHFKNFWMRLCTQNLKTLLWFNQFKFKGAYLDWGSGRAAFLWGGEKPNGLHYSALSFAGEFDFS